MCCSLRLGAWRKHAHLLRSSAKVLSPKRYISLEGVALARVNATLFGGFAGLIATVAFRLAVLHLDFQPTMRTARDREAIDFDISVE